MTTPVERVQTALETLGLKAVEARLENLLEEAAKKEPSYADFLHDLLNCEVEARRSRYLRARLGEDRVTIQLRDGSPFSVPVSWTDAVPADVYVIVGGGRSRFRVEDLLVLAELIAANLGRR